MADTPGNHDLRALLERLQAGDEAAWAQFHAFYWDLINGWATRWGCPRERVPDVYQQVMLQLWRERAKWRPADGSLRRLLSTMVHRRVMDELRTLYRVHPPRTTSPAADELAGPVTLPAVTARDAVWLRSVLAEALRCTYATTAPLAYKCFCGNVLDGIPAATLAHDWKITPRQVYGYKDEVMARLQSEFAALLIALDDHALSLWEATGLAGSKALAEALAAYVEHRRELRATRMDDTPPPAVSSHLSTIRVQLRQHAEPPGPGAWVLLPRSEPPWVALQPGATVGRDATCTIVVRGPGVSGLHARFTADATGWQVEDLQSTNGTRVNGQRVRTARVAAGDLVHLAQQPLLVMIVEPCAAVP